MSLVSSILGAFSSQKAADAQKRAADAANNTIKQQYEQTRADLAPYRQGGQQALGQYQGLLGLNGKDAQSAALSQYTESPFLSQLVNNTTRAVEGSRAARGGLFSGGTAQEIGNKAGQLYLSDYNNYLSRIGGMTDMGANAAAQTGQFGANAAAQRGQYFTDRGNANANSIMAPYNGYRQFSQDAAKAFGAYNGGAFG